MPTDCQCNDALKITGGKPGMDCPSCHGSGITSGISPERRSVPLLTGGAVHVGLATLLLRGAAVFEVELAVAAATAAYRQELEGCCIDIRSTEEAQYVVAEQLALTEALVRLAALRVVPGLLERYEVVWVERDLQQPLAEGVVLRGRCDGLLRERASGDLFVLSWKTKGSSRLDDRALEDAQHDDQGLSETWLVERWLEAEWREIEADAKNADEMAPGFPRETSGVLMCWLLKGDRRESSKGSGVWQQTSPLIRAYRRFKPDGEPEYAWSYYWDDATGGHKLGKGWVKVDMWTEPGGIKGWVERLAAGGVQPEAGDCLSEQFVMPAPYYRQPGDVTDWVADAVDQETEALERRNKSWKDGSMPRRQHRHSCSYPGRCAYYKLCWGSQYDKEHPLEAGYVRRTPYVPAEVEVSSGSE